MPSAPPVFRPQGRPSPREVDRARGSAQDRGYNSRWTKASKGYLRSHPVCLGCEAVGRIEGASCTDHTIPHKGDRALFWDRENWQPSCGWHHERVKKRLEAMYQAGRIGAADLRLDSAVAKRLTLNLGPR